MSGRPSAIVSVKAREILDSRGNPTLEVEVRSASLVGKASVPSGASTGSHEARELRDGDVGRFHGRGVTKAAANVNVEICEALKGRDCADQRDIDRTMIELDGTPDKSRLGANAIVGVSMASARLAAAVSGKPLFASFASSEWRRSPVPMMNVINGGEHADNGLAVQEFMVEPVGAETCADAVRMGSEVYQTLKGVLSSKYGKGATNVGDEGGFAPPMRLTREALDALAEAVKKSGYGASQVRLGIDAAASTFFDKKTGTYSADGKEMSRDELGKLYERLRDEYGLLLIEDPFSEDDFESFAQLTRALGGRTSIIGDDIYVTSLARIRAGIQAKATNAVLIKLNQVGTVSETIDAVKATQEARWRVAVSHRSGETADPFIAHLATGLGAEFIKAGAPARGERVEKYNELTRIAEELGAESSYAGRLFDG